MNDMRKPVGGLNGKRLPYGKGRILRNEKAPTEAGETPINDKQLLLLRFPVYHKYCEYHKQRGVYIYLM